ncbi:Uncharacterized protein Fot_29195 [Forsythia ovata]|uniref:Uncharacterized protein n=1 Tax=Forsythia ovata TaxID=205694 RepID=A0ABD1TR80_9LAMI
MEKKQHNEAKGPNSTIGRLESQRLIQQLTTLPPFPLPGKPGRSTIHARLGDIGLVKLEAMDRKFNVGSISLQKKLADSRRPIRKEQIPDLTDLMNDMFFGSVNTDK